MPEKLEPERGAMNDTVHNHDAEDDSGDRLARHVATGVASLIGIAIVAAGGAIYSNSLAIARLAEKCEARSADVFELHDTLNQYPSAADLIGCRQRLEKLEQYQALDHHRMDKLEKLVDELARKPEARPDPFTGSEGRELRGRIESLERRGNGT
jgi:hypothetical protein